MDNSKSYEMTANGESKFLSDVWDDIGDILLKLAESREASTLEAGKKLADIQNRISHRFYEILKNK